MAECGCAPEQHSEQDTARHGRNQGHLFHLPNLLYDSGVADGCLKKPSIRFSFRQRSRCCMKKTIRLVLLTALVASPLLLAAHPMGNFSINHHSKIHVSSGAISITTILDFAEISTFQL